MCCAGVLSVGALMGASCGSGEPPPVDGALAAASAEVATSDNVSPPPLAPPAPPQAAEHSQIMVEVQGAVARPGMYRIPSGARIHDALERAGGPTADAEIRDLNIAARLADGSVLSIPYAQRPGGRPEATAAQLNPPRYTRSGWREGGGEMVQSGTATASGAGCIDLNTATQAELETLPGIGPKTAMKIIHYRTQQPFTQVEDLRNIQGIADKRLESLRGLVCVS